MFRYVLATILLGATISLTGCVTGPCDYSHDGCGPQGHCGGPMDCLNQWHRDWLCGGAGCCEVYHDEWCSTPPDCADPCCFDYPPQHHGLHCCGCGVPGCRGGCSVQPIRRVCSALGSLYGRRHCEGCGHGIGDCCCEDPYASYGCGCDSCGGGGCDGGGSHDYYPAPHHGPGPVHGPVPTSVPQPYTGLEEIGTYEGGGTCANGNCNLASRSNQATSSRTTSVARQQMLTRRAATAAGSVPGMPVSGAQPEAMPNKFYRQASPLPPGQATYRR